MKQIASSLLVLVVLLSVGCQKSAQEELAEKILQDREKQKAFVDDEQKKIAAERKKNEEKLKKYGAQTK